ncbi:hypothetical protein K450DRAFT_275702 [Umbelopsis ramanniana AG]|uniref:Uncharacterized protein n=1 Tax=Umbelopsis ramanniana AG TaxID=1314678 RepID=A0AAD5E1S6_UMBRA|nr:uncharacterized protein K450DRAFT_275702 [Umbelopsis ramanniana AG]KAI8575347.1 hypothetical protein K450DRAFT_275702 [Umbelopsis ramanniana AG]
MSQIKSLSGITILPCLASFETPGYDADISSIGLHSMDTVSTSQGGYSADGEDKGQITRVNRGKLARQVSSETIFASDDEEDVNWGLILAHIDGQQSDKGNPASQSTVSFKLEEETETIDILRSQNGTENFAAIKQHEAELQSRSRTLSDHASPLSNRPSQDHDSIAIDNLHTNSKLDSTKTCYMEEEDEEFEETQVYSVHDPLEEHEDLDHEPNATDDGVSKNVDQCEEEARKPNSQHSEDYPETQVYDVYEPLTQNDEDPTDVIVKASMEQTIARNDNNSSTVRQQSTLSMTWTLDGMRVADSDSHTANSLHMDMEQRDEVKVSERNKNSGYVLYKGTQSLINSLHASQQLPDDIDYVETSDSEELHDNAASLAGSQRSMNVADNAGDILAEVDSPKKLQAVIQSTFPSSIEDMEDRLASRYVNNNYHDPTATHETLQSSQQSTSSSSQQKKLAFDRVVKKPRDTRKRSSARLDDTMTNSTSASKADDTESWPPIPKRRPVLGLAKPSATSTVRATKSNATRLSPKPPAKATRRLYGVNHRRKPTPRQ